jgi:hypothetical protein
VGRSCRLYYFDFAASLATLAHPGDHAGIGAASLASSGASLIKKVREADPLRCPEVLTEMRIVSLIDEKDVIERILRHLVLRKERCACIPPPTRRATPFSIRGSTTLPRLPH